MATINENAARIAKELSSFSDYKEGRKPAFLTLRAHVTPASPMTTAPAATVKNMTAS